MRYFKLKTSCWLERGDVLEVAERLTASSRCHRLRCNSLIESTVVADAYHSSSLEKRVSVCNREVSGRGFMLYYHAKSSTHYPRLYSRVYLQDILPNKSSEKNELVKRGGAIEQEESMGKTTGRRNAMQQRNNEHDHSRCIFPDFSTCSTYCDTKILKFRRWVREVLDFWVITSHNTTTTCCGGPSVCSFVVVACHVLWRGRVIHLSPL